jgi:hypothetical protein
MSWSSVRPWSVAIFQQESPGTTVYFMQGPVLVAEALVEVLVLVDDVVAMVVVGTVLSKRASWRFS